MMVLGGVTAKESGNRGGIAQPTLRMNRAMINLVGPKFGVHSLSAHSASKQCERNVGFYTAIAVEQFITTTARAGCASSAVWAPASARKTTKDTKVRGSNSHEINVTQRPPQSSEMSNASKLAKHQQPSLLTHLRKCKELNNAHS